MAPDQTENAEEKEAVCDIEKIVKIPDGEKFAAGKVTDNAGQHEQCAKNAGSPAQIMDKGRKFHSGWFLGLIFKFKVFFSKSLLLFFFTCNFRPLHFYSRKV